MKIINQKKQATFYLDYIPTLYGQNYNDNFYMMLILK